ncbi:MAG: hypothetical protein OJF50_002751 [Nitrospira sp.]|jgi:tetratricopeptide (TPR) repeat protein|nr:hypothetical protein [Nitrospira sp.]
MKRLSTLMPACLLLGFGLTTGCIVLEQSRSIDELMRIGKCKDKDTCQRLIQSAKNTIAAFKTPNTAMQFADRAVAHTTLDHRKEAASDFEKVVELNLKDDPAPYEKVKYAFMSEHWVEERAYAEGWEYIARKSYAKAVSTFGSIKKSALHLPGFDVGYALALCENGQCAKGVEVLEEAIRKSPEHYATHLTRTTEIRSRAEYRDIVHQRSDNSRMAQSGPTTKRDYLELVGPCANLTKYLTTQTTLKQLPGVYKKEASTGNAPPGIGTYVQISALADGYFLIVEGTGSSPDQRPVNEKLSFAGFVQLLMRPSKCACITSLKAHFFTQNRRLLSSRYALFDDRLSRSAE